MRRLEDEAQFRAAREVNVKRALDQLVEAHLAQVADLLARTGTRGILDGGGAPGLLGEMHAPGVHALRMAGGAGAHAQHDRHDAPPRLDGEPEIADVMAVIAHLTVAAVNEDLGPRAEVGGRRSGADVGILGGGYHDALAVPEVLNRDGPPSRHGSVLAQQPHLARVAPRLAACHDARGQLHALAGIRRDVHLRLPGGDAERLRGDDLHCAREGPVRAVCEEQVRPGGHFVQVAEAE